MRCVAQRLTVVRMQYCWMLLIQWRVLWVGFYAGIAGAGDVESPPLLVPY